MVNNAGNHLFFIEWLGRCLMSFAVTHMDDGQCGLSITERKERVKNNRDDTTVCVLYVGARSAGVYPLA